MKSAIIQFDEKKNFWFHNNRVYSNFFEALQHLSKDYDVIGWSYFKEDVVNLQGLISKNYTDSIPEMVTYGSPLFLANTEYLESNNVFFNSYSRQNDLSFDTWRIRCNSGYISATIIRELLYFKFPKNYKISLSVLAYASFRFGAIVKVSYSSKLILKHINGLTNKEYITFLNYTKKKHWILFYCLSMLFFEGKFLFPLMEFVNSKYEWFQNKPSLWKKIDSFEIDKNKMMVDVVIPTLGRPDYLLNVVKDLNEQSFGINKLYIIEQKIPGQQETLLQNILDLKLNFKIKHVLLDKLGVCNARNIGIQLSEANYLLMFDDDVRIVNQPNFIESLIKKIEFSKAYAIVFATTGKKGNVKLNMSSTISGCSSLFKKDKIHLFNLQIEGFGSDDQEFNFSVRDSIERVVYTEEEFVDHLRAPIGGWRFDKTKYLPWLQSNKIIPLPGPVTTYRYLKYATPNQLKGYKFFIFVRYYSFKFWKYFLFLKRWNKSIHWANQILEDKVSVEIK